MDSSRSGISCGKKFNTRLWIVSVAESLRNQICLRVLVKEPIPHDCAVGEFYVALQCDSHVTIRSLHDQRWFNAAHIHSARHAQPAQTVPRCTTVNQCVAKAGANLIMHVPGSVSKLTILRFKVGTVIGSHAFIALTHQRSTSQCRILDLMKMTVCAPVRRPRRVIGLSQSEQRRVTECPVDAVPHARSWFTGDFFWNIDCGLKKIGIFVLFDKILFWGVLAVLVVTVAKSGLTCLTVGCSSHLLVN